MLIRKEDSLPVSFSTTAVLVGGYLTLQFLANLTVAKRLVVFNSLLIPVGSLLWAISFTWIDLINDRLGKTNARFLVLVGIAANIAAISWFEFYLRVNGSPDWQSNTAKQNAIEFVLGGYWRVYLAGIVTNFVVENSDITAFHYMKRKYPGLPRWVRSLASNTLSCPLDGVLFAYLAFVGTMPHSDVLLIALSSAGYKLVVGYVSSPLIYLVSSRKEQLYSTRGDI